MPLLAPPSSGKNFTPAAEGLVQGVIAKVVDLGIVKGEYQGKPTEAHKIQIIWQVAEKDEEGQPKRVSEFFTFSNNEKAKLYKRMVNLFGKPVPDTFDYEKLIGIQRNLVLVHTISKKNGNTYANVETTLKLNPGQAKLEIVPFELKKKDEVKAAAPVPGSPVTPDNPILPEEIPF